MKKKALRLLLAVMAALDLALFLAVGAGELEGKSDGFWKREKISSTDGQKAGTEPRTRRSAAREEGAKADAPALEEEPEPAFSGYLALTFDDGPKRGCTDDLLDGLKARGVKATFFLMGQSIEGNEDLVLRMRDEGHLVGNHSYRHMQLTKEGAGAVCRAVDKTSRLIEEITGKKPQYLRPPYGDWSEELECQVDMTTVLWSVDSLDWKLRDRQKIVSRVMDQARDGDIILLHDIFPTSVEAALELIDRLGGQGYTFVTVDELLIE